MDIQQFIEKMKICEEYLIEYIENQQNDEENYQKLLNLFKDQNIFNTKHSLKTLLYIIIKISNNHIRLTNFNEKIRKIIIICKDHIKKHFLNNELFKLFKNNKLLILFLLKENVLTMNSAIILTMIEGKMKDQKYPEYFMPEIKPLIGEIDDKEDQKYLEIIGNLPDDFDEKRKIGENDDMLYEIIRKDMIEEFISNVKSRNFELNITIEESIYETNPFLLKNKQTTLIEYSAFFGASQIFRYLYLNGVDLTSNLWFYAIHGDNAEIIKVLEEKKIMPPDVEKCLQESIKCHHNDIVKYIIRNYMKKESENIVRYCFHYYNFPIHLKIEKNMVTFCIACLYDHYEIVSFILDQYYININECLPIHI